MSDGYPLRPLGEVMHLDIRRVPMTPANTYRLAGVLNAGQGVIAKGEFDGGDTEYAAMNVLRVDQVVMRKLTAWEGPIAVVPAEFDGFVVSNEFPTFTLGPDLMPDWMRHLCRSPRLWAEMKNRVRGTVQRRKRLNPEQLLQIQLPIPTREVQAGIVEMLDAVDDQIIALDAEALALDALLRGRKEELFECYAATGTTLPIGEVLEEVKRPIIIDAAAEYRQIGIRSHGRGLFTKEAVTGESLGSKKVFWVEPGDLIINIVFAWEGAAAIVPPDIEGYCGSHRFPAYRRLDGGDVEFFRLFFSTKTGTRLLANCSPGGAGRNRTLSRTRLLQSPISMPSAQEQKRTIRELQALEVSITAVRTEAARLRETRAGLLSNLLNRTIEIESTELEG
jgi:type I restriction enzyme S subunit